MGQGVGLLTLTHLAGMLILSAYSVPRTGLAVSLEVRLPTSTFSAFCSVHGETRELIKKEYHMPGIVVLIYFIGEEKEDQKYKVHLHDYAGGIREIQRRQWI